MARRLRQTLADYMVIAISPALIMLLVGSLMYFLLRLFYQGDFQERLHWVMTCFVFASVLIARISIEQGFERAAPFGAALAILVALATHRFMEYRGTWVDSYGWLVNLTVIGIVWWCVHKLTWDCTVIDEAEDASGEGLMQVVGLEKSAKEENHSSPAEQQLEGTTTRDVPAGFWQRYVQRQHRPHAPGVWVVYFSLAALPIFGIGQWFIPAADVEARRYVFWLLCVYVASGLSLLVTTSFLGLRRYLRQRRIEMPTVMANLWLTTGAVIIVALLAAATLLPRPSAEYAVSELPISIGSPEADSSSYAPSTLDGTRDDQPGRAAQREDDEPSGDTPPPDGAGNQPGGESQGGSTSSSAGEKSNAAGEGQQSGGQSQGQSQGGKQAGGQGDQGQQSNTDSSGPQSESQSGDSNGQKSQGTKQQPAEGNQSQQQPQQQQGEPAPDRKPGGKSPLENIRDFRKLERELAAEYEDKPKQDEADEGEGEEPEEEANRSIETPPIEPPLGWLAGLMKLAFYALVILGTLYALWRYRHEVLASIRSFLDELRAWWHSLWGGPRQPELAEGETLNIRVPAAPFASYADPFASGAASSMSREELVRYSFEAFEAWSREHGCEREADQTPHELAREVARLNAPIASDARNLAELYARAAFAKGRLPDTTAEQIEQLWRQMRREAGVGA